MTFNKNIPQPTDRLATSQRDLLNNNLQLNTSFGVNHYPFDDVSGNTGRHTFVEIPVRAAIPPGLQAGESTLYSKASLVSTELFFTRGVTGVEVQMTNLNPSYNTLTTKGQTFLPGGLLLQWGTAMNSFDGDIVTYVTPFSVLGVPTNAYSIQLTFAQAAGISSSISVGGGGSTTDSQFVIRMAGVTNIHVFWMAIGSRT